MTLPLDFGETTGGIISNENAISVNSLDYISELTGGVAKQSSDMLPETKAINALSSNGLDSITLNHALEVNERNAYWEVSWGKNIDVESIKILVSSNPTYAGYFRNARISLIKQSGIVVGVYDIDQIIYGNITINQFSVPDKYGNPSVKFKESYVCYTIKIELKPGSITPMILALSRVTVSEVINKNVMVKGNIYLLPGLTNIRIEQQARPTIDPYDLNVSQPLWSVYTSTLVTAENMEFIRDRISTEIIRRSNMAKRATNLFIGGDLPDNVNITQSIYKATDIIKIIRCVLSPGYDVNTEPLYDSDVNIVRSNVTTFMNNRGIEEPNRSVLDARLNILCVSPLGGSMSELGTQLSVLITSLCEALYPGFDIL